MKKPFDLEQAVAGKPVVTRESKAVVKVVSFVGIATITEFPIMFCLEGFIYCCTAEGKMYPGNDEGSRDLFMHVEDEAVWVNVYQNPNGSKHTHSYPTQAAADESAVSVVTWAERMNGKAYKLVLDGEQNENTTRPIGYI